MVILGGDGRRSRPEVGDVEVREGVVDEAVHGARVAVHVLIHQSGDEVGREGDHKGLMGRRMELLQLGFVYMH